MKELTLDVVTEAYVKSREQIILLKTQIEDIEVKQRKKEEWLLTELQKNGLQNAKTLSGTVYQTVKESVTVADGDTFLGWVRENDGWEFINKAANKTAVLELMGDDRGAPPPPGVNYAAVRTVGIRKS